MLKDESITYHCVSEEVFEHVKEQLDDVGIRMSLGNSGEVSGEGIKASFEWDGKSALRLTINEKLPYTSHGMIFGKIADYVDECQ